MDDRFVPTVRTRYKYPFPKRKVEWEIKGPLKTYDSRIHHEPMTIFIPICLNTRAQPIGWPTTYGPSQPSIWGLGGQTRRRLRGRPRGRSRKAVDHVNILRYLRKSLFPMFRGISLDISLCRRISVCISMGISIGKSVEFHPPLQNRQMML